ncbi:MAG: DUF4387 domain-containing protein [Peptococcaceae bacterium]
MTKVKLKSLAKVIRSKNAGPFELTLDIIFPEERSFEKVRKSGVLNAALFARLYGLNINQVLSVVEFPAALAIKTTLVRPVPSGHLGDGDVYGAQQHVPLLDVEIPLEKDG